ncbi:MAG: hypothetical protein NXI10_07660 [bacterium]|nr:hypothetical protein [bacterium]
MKQLTLAAFIAFGLLQAYAQEFSIKEGGTAEMEKQKDSEANSFTAGGTHYHITSYFKSPSFAYQMASVSEDGSNFQTADLTIGPGELSDAYSISEVLGIGNQAYVIVNNQKSDPKSRILSARKLSADGTIQESGTELMSFGYEKMLRTGRMIVATSPNGKNLVVVGVLPFDKKESRKFQIRVFDENLNETSSGEFELEGLAIKNARFEAVIADDKTVYINRYTAKMKDGVKILVHEYSPKSSSLENTYLVEAAEGEVMGDYLYATNANGELVIAAAFRKDIKVYTGDEEQTGVFIFRNVGKSEGVIEYNNLDTPAPNFELTGIHFNGEVTYVTGEDAKMDKTSPAQTTPTTANSTFTFTHGNEYILGFNPSGQKTFEILLETNMSARTTKHTLYSAAHVINGELIYIFNDQFSKYRDEDDIASGGTIPVATRINSSGEIELMEPFMNDLKLSNGYILLPNYSTVSGNTVSLLSRDGKKLKSVQISVE